jgi:hypothetical protein
MRYVLIENGEVTRAIECDPDFAASLGAVRSDAAVAGDKWDGAQFSQGEPPEKSREELKRERDAAVRAIKVTTAAGRVFDGDETSQGRMTRAITALKAAGQTETTWVLADNTPVAVSVAELEEALILAGLAQTALWPI